MTVSETYSYPATSFILSKERSNQFIICHVDLINYSTQIYLFKACLFEIILCTTTLISYHFI